MNLIINRFGSTIKLFLDGQIITLEKESNSEAKEFLKELITLYNQYKESDSPQKEQIERTILDIIKPSIKLKQIKGLIIKENKYYLEGTNIPMPEILVNKIIDYIDLNLSVEGLFNFWRLLLLNPNKEAIESFPKFADHFQFTITNHGYFVAYKAVASKGELLQTLATKVMSELLYLKGNKVDPSNITVIELIQEDKTSTNKYHFINTSKQSIEEYLKIDSEGYKLIKNYIEDYEDEDYEDEDYEDEDYEGNYFIDENGKKYTEESIKIEYKVLGTLDKVHKDILNYLDSKEEQYTDIHSGTTDIRLGKVVKIDRKDCDSDASVTCSKGLHVGTPEYVSNFGESRNPKLICYVNPRHIVAVPHDYDGQKMRVCEYYVAGISQIDENDKIEELKTSYLEDDYFDYEIKEIQAELENLKESQLEENSNEQVRANILAHRLIQL